MSSPEVQQGRAEQIATAQVHMPDIIHRNSEKQANHPNAKHDQLRQQAWQHHHALSPQNFNADKDA